MLMFDPIPYSYNHEDNNRESQRKICNTIPNIILFIPNHEANIWSFKTHRDQMLTVDHDSQEYYQPLLMILDATVEDNAS